MYKSKSKSSTADNGIRGQKYIVLSMKIYRYCFVLSRIEFVDISSTCGNFRFIRVYMITTRQKEFIYQNWLTRLWY